VKRTIAIFLTAATLAACQSGSGEPGSGPTDAFDGISEGETIRLTGTEPFWGGEIAQGEARYTTPDIPDGIRFPVQRFAGNNGLAFTGTMDGTSFDLTVTPGECSDGMSDRTYPYTATLLIGGEQRTGCAYTDAQPFTGPENP
jgi:uncharacterized membrane protein